MSRAYFGLMSRAYFGLKLFFVSNVLVKKDSGKRRNFKNLDSDKTDNSGSEDPGTRDAHYWLLLIFA